MHSFLAHLLVRTPARPSPARILACTLGLLVGAFALPHASAQELLREAFAREFTVNVGGNATTNTVSREFTVNVGDAAARPYGEVVSREVSMLMPTTDVPAMITQARVTSSPTGETAVITWDGYLELAQRDIIRYDIYRASVPFTDLAQATKIAEVGAGLYSYTVTGLTAWQDQYFAVVPVDALNQRPATFRYSASYVIIPELISREFTVNIGGAPESRQTLSREVALLNASAARPAALTGLNVSVSPTGEIAILDWSTYPEIAQRDVLRYDIYQSAVPFTDPAQGTKIAEVGAGLFNYTVTGLPAWQDQYFMVVPVDGLGQIPAATPYGASYVLTREVISRECTVAVGGGATSDFPQTISREVSLLVPSTAVPAPVTGLNSGFSAAPSFSQYRAVELAWPNYPELAQVDVARYRIYVGASYFEDVAGMQPFTYVPAGRLAATITGLASRGIYYFAAVAEDALGQFNPAVRSVSAQASTGGVGEVGSFTVTSEPDALTFHWIVPAEALDFLAGFRVYFAGTPTPVDLGAAVRSHRVTGLATAHDYPCRITTVDVFGNETAGTTVIGATLLPNPANGAATAINHGARLTWDPVAPANLVARYAVYARTTPITDVTGLVPVAESTGISATVGNLANGTTYHFAVTTINISGGETTAVTSITATPVSDTAGPRALSTAPTGTIAAPFSSLDFVFSEPVDPATVGASTVALTGPLGVIAPLTLEFVNPTTLRATFAAQNRAGAYVATIGLAVTDLSGNPMNQDGDATNGELGADSFTTTLTIPTPLLPDLVVENLQILGTGAVGSPAEVRWTLRNNGTTPTSATWKDNVALSWDGTAAHLFPLASVASSEPIPTGGSVERSYAFTVPANGPTGAVRAVVTTNADRDLDELNFANNTGLSAGTLSVPTTLTFTVAPNEVHETDGARAATGTLTRNGSRLAALAVSLVSSDTGSATVPATVVIPAGQASATFNIAAVADAVIDGDKTVSLSATATGFPAAGATVRVLDATLPQLTLAAAAGAALEGEKLTFTLTRPQAKDTPLIAYLRTSPAGTFTVPAAVQIPANVASLTFEVEARQDVVIQRDRSVTFTATAADHTPGAATITLIDDDTPVLTLTLARDSIRENAGPAATTGIVRRANATSEPLTVELANSAPAAAAVPTSVVIPANAVTATFVIGAIDNTALDGNRAVEITGRVFASGVEVASTSPAILIVRDDDAPGLLLVLTRDVAAEGLSPAVRASVALPAPLATPTIVTLTSNRPELAQIPATVTIPAGQTTATFNVNTPTVPGEQGNREVALTATLAGYSDDVADLVVTDLTLPDLLPSNVVIPATAETDTYVNATYHVDNFGLAAASGQWSERIYLSTTPTMAGAVLAGMHTFGGTVPAEQFYERSVPVRLPREAGQYWVLVEVNAGVAGIAEILTTNNTAPSNDPIRVEAAYSATVQADFDFALAGEPVVLGGHATRRGGNDPAPSVLVNVHLGVRGTTRVLSALTDQNGNFTVTFQPLAGEGGLYTIGAAHPGQKTAPVQDTFEILGLRPSGAALTPFTFSEAGNAAGSFKLTNAGETPLTGLAVAFVDKPDWLGAVVTPSAADFGPLGEVIFSVALNGQTGGFGSGTFRIRVTTAEGVTYEVPVTFDVRNLVPKLVATPGQLTASMLVGGQRIVPFTLRNDGGAATGPLQVLLPAAPWLGLATPANVASLAPGESTTIELQLTPAATLPLTQYQGTLALQPATGASLQVPFTFRAVSNGQGNLAISVVDEFFYFSADKPKLAGATVIVRDPFTADSLASATTDAAGNVAFPNLAEGYYALEVRAPNHQTNKLNVFVEPGATTTRQVFLTYEAVRYSWSVKETEIQDHYNVTITPTFETNVPVPVVVCEPGVIDLAELQVPGQSMQVNLTFTNHGLIAAENLKINLPSEADHPYYRFIPLVDQIGTLGAKSSITVPVVVYYLDPSAAPAAAAPGLAGTSARAAAGTVLAAGEPEPCSMRGGSYDYSYPCGKDRVNKAGPIVPTNYRRRNCHSDPVFIGGGTGGSGGGASGVSSSSVLTPMSLCLCAQPNCDQTLGCFTAGFEFELPSLVGELIEKLSAKLPSWVQIGAPEIGLEVEGELCLCCDRDCNTSWSVKGTITASVTASVIIGREFSMDMEFPLDGFVSASASVSATAGVPIELTGEVSVSGERDCNGEYRACFDGLIQLDIFAGVKGEASVSASDELGHEFSGSVEAKVGFSGYAKATVHGCTDSEAVFKACVGPITAHCSLTGTISAPGMEDRSITAGGSKNVWEGTCGPEEGALPPSASAASADGPQIAAAIRPVDDTDWPIVDRHSGAVYVTDPVRVLNHLIQQASADAQGDGVCARVRLQIDQDVVMTRSAFAATLKLENDRADALTAIGIEIAITDEAGNSATNLFSIRPPQLTGIANVDGTGALPANSDAAATWTIVPTDAAAPLQPTRYAVAGTLRYTMDGQALAVPLSPVAITVRPDAALTLEYFHQRDVFSDDPHTDPIEPAQPYTLAVLIKNNGAGAARHLTIASAQPKIVENEKGLLIDFQIIGTEMAAANGTPAELTPSLTANFGDIAAGEVRAARWLLTSSLQGLFIDYEATFEHLDGNGDPRLSLIKGVSIHEMIRQVVDASGRWAFLANDVTDTDDLPDTLHFSDGATAPAAVSVVRTATASAAPTVAAPDVTLSVTLPAGWSYLRVADPANGSMRLASVTRADGSVVPLANWWVTDRTFIGLGRRPRVENNLHLLDRDGSATYLLHYVPRTDIDTTAPSTHVRSLPLQSYANIPVQWEGTDAGSSIRYDVFVSADGGAFTPWLTETTASGSVFTGEVGHSYAFYSRGHDAAGNYEDAPPAPDATTAVTQSNVPPVLAAIADQSINPGDTLTLQLAATDANTGSVLTFRLGEDSPAGIVLNPDTGELSWQTNRTLGGRSYAVTVEVWDDGVPRLGAFRVFHVGIAAPRPLPVITWPAPAAITYGTPLSATHLGATANIPGTFTYTPALGTILGAGADQVLSLAFTPADTATYDSVTIERTLTVHKAPATIALADLVHHFDGTAKSATATATPAGLSVSLTYANSSVLPSKAGVYALVATVNDANYTGSAMATFVIDDEAPTSSVNPLPEFVESATFPVSWSGTDIGAGVASYDVYVSVNGRPFTLWLAGTTAASASYAGQDGDVLAFYSIARDNFGHLEAAPLNPDASTHVVLTRNYPAWLEIYFHNETGNLATKLTRWGPNADPDGDGVPNFMEYAFGLHPLQPSRNGLPVLSIQTNPAGGLKHLTLTYTMPASATDIAAIPQISSDLAAWNFGPNAIEVVSDTVTAGVRTVVVRDVTPLAESSSRFLRVQVSLH